MERPDLTNDLIHLIRADTLPGALDTLQRILQMRALLGSDRMVKGRHKVICFSEAPAKYLGYAIAHQEPSHQRYQPVGILISKAQLYKCGGRPVIYQPDSEYTLLPPSLRWRHVRYDPHIAPAIDFTWEREWRVATEKLDFSASDVRVVLPTQEVIDWVKKQHEREQDWQEHIYSHIIGDQLARMSRNDFPWTTVNLRLDQIT